MLERLSWKRLALSWLFCLPALLLGLIFGYLPWFLLASALAALVWNFYNQLKLPLAVDRPQHDAAARPLELGAAVLWPVSDAAAQSPPPARAGAADQRFRSGPNRCLMRW